MKDVCSTHGGSLYSGNGMHMFEVVICFCKSVLITIYHLWNETEDMIGEIIERPG